jgi:hypothetical protein
LQWLDEVANPNLEGLCKSSKEAFYSLFTIAKKTFQAKMDSFLSDPNFVPQSWVEKKINEMVEKNWMKIQGKSRRYRNEGEIF